MEASAYTSKDTIKSYRIISDIIKKEAIFEHLRVKNQTVKTANNHVFCRNLSTKFRASFEKKLTNNHVFWRNLSTKFRASFKKKLANRIRLTKF